MLEKPLSALIPAPPSRSLYATRFLSLHPLLPCSRSELSLFALCRLFVGPVKPWQKIRRGLQEEHESPFGRTSSFLRSATFHFHPFPFQTASASAARATSNLTFGRVPRRCAVQILALSNAMLSVNCCLLTWLLLVVSSLLLLPSALGFDMFLEQTVIQALFKENSKSAAGIHQQL